MDITGARWSLTGAETIPTPRAINSTGHLSDYWTYRTTEERQRNYSSTRHNQAA